MSSVLAGFAHSSVWLIVSAFLFSHAVASTGLGRRIAFLFIRAFGYGFASMTAHVTAMYGPFLAVAVAAGAPARLAALILAFFSNLNASLTHYSTGPAPIFCGAGYVSQPAWWRLGFVVPVINLLIWTRVALPYWKLIGIW